MREEIGSVAGHVLDVGQCVPDHAAIRRLLESNFAVNVVQAHDAVQTLSQLRNGTFELVLINRKLDLDYSDGMEILKQIKSDPKLAAIPVMLVTNYPEHQQSAVAAGAEPGFGKNELRNAQTLEKLKKFLA